MVKVITLAVLLFAAAIFVGGCRFGAAGLESVSGAECGGGNIGPSKTSMIVRNWARDMRKQERFVDKHFLNYDINDPYRGDCLAGY